MKSYSGYSAFIVLVITICSYSASGQEVPWITAEEMPGFTMNRNDSFDGESLWGYINGGADIYLEYGFEAVRVEEFSNEDETILLEIYRMNDPVSAFGIYSTKTHKCSQREVATSTDCLNPYQFQLIYGDYYIQLINESASEKAQQIMIGIAEMLLRKMEFKELILPVEYLTDSLKFSLADIKMVKGVLGLQNNAMDLADCFPDPDAYQIYFAKTIVNGEKVKYYEIVFDEPGMKTKFLEHNQDKGLNIVKEWESGLLIQK